LLKKVPSQHCAKMFQLLLVVRDDKQQFRENKLVGQLLKMETETFFRFFIIYKMFYTERKLNRLSNVIFIFDCHCPKHQTKATSSHSTSNTDLLTEILL
jgi:hypothetical protein